MLEDSSEIEVIADVESGEGLLNLLKTRSPHVILLDLYMPGMNGLETLKIVKRQFPHIYVMIFSMAGNPSEIREALSSGAKGFVSKSVQKTELIQGVKKVSMGETFLDEETKKKYFEDIQDGIKPHNNTFKLTEREQEILALIAKGLRGAEIAAQLHMQPTTVDRHRKNILRKSKAILDLQTMHGVVAYAVKHKII